MKRFRPNHFGQNFLLPPDVNEWLSEKHFARFLHTLVADSLDLSSIRSAYYTKSGSGAPPYDPAMMVTLLIYCYCMGRRSSRIIESMTYDDLGVRYLTGNQHPDHDTVAAFRKRHLAAVTDLFRQVLQICEGVGLLRAGDIALYLDGTKILANASRHQTVTYAKVRKTEAQLAEDVDRILREAQEIDDAEDEAERRGDRDIAKELADPVEARKRIKAAKAALDKMTKVRQEMESAARRQAQAEVVAAEQKREAHESEQKPGRKPVVPDIDDLIQQKLDVMQINLTDPDSRLMKDGATKAIVQGYNCQAVVAKGSQVIVAYDAVNEENDIRQLAPMATKADEELALIGVVPGQKVPFAADAGYLSVSQVGLLDTSRFDLHVAPGKKAEPGADARGQDGNNARSEGATPDSASDAVADAGVRRPDPVEPPRRGGFTMYTAPEPEPTEAALLQARMKAKLATDEGKEFYRHRSSHSEAVFGEIKENRGMRRMKMRGLVCAVGEWGMTCLSHNILKLYRYMQKEADAAEREAATSQAKQEAPAKPAIPDPRQSCVKNRAINAELALGWG